MFGLFNNSTNQPSATSIKEANEQLQAMHWRISDLEQRIREQIELLERREQENLGLFNQMKSQKETEIKQLKQELLRSEEKSVKLQGMIKERDVQIAFLLHRCSYLDEAASYAPLLDQLSHCLKGAFAAPPPKVQTVKPTRPNPEPSAAGSAKARSSTPTPVGHHQTAARSSQSSAENILRQAAPGTSSQAVIKTTNQNGHVGKMPVVSYGVPFSQ